MNAAQTINVLLVEDNPTDVLLTREALDENRQFDLTVVERLGGALEMLKERRFDVVLLDLGLPDSQGLETLLKLRQGTTDVPVVVMTARDDEELALRAVQEGAQDYLVKSQVEGHNLRRVIRYAIERQRAEASLTENKTRLEAIVTSAIDAILSVNADQRIVLFNSAAERMFGVPASQMMGKPLESLIPERYRLVLQNHIQSSAETGISSHQMGQLGSISGVRASGEEFPIEASISQSQVAGEKWFTAILRDISDRKRLTEILQERAVLASLTADVGLAFTKGGPIRESLQACAESMVRNLTAAFARIWLLNEAENVLELQASAGLYTHVDGPYGRVPVGKYKIGLIAKEKQPHLSNDVLVDPRFSDLKWAKREGMVAFAGYPLLTQDRLVGVLVMFARHTLSNSVLDAMASVANNIAIGIDRNRSEGALHESEQRFRQMAENLDEAVWLSNADGSKLLYISPTYERMTGQPCESLYGNPISFIDVIHEADRKMAEVMYKSLPAELNFEYRAVRPDRSIRRLSVRAFPLADDRGAVDRVVGIVQDVTEQRRLEEQFRQSQKMEAIGSLAGGVAHDFNNLLTIINGYSEIILPQLSANSPLRELVRNIGEAGDRAASLTRQLLAFSRKQILEPKVLQLNTIVADLGKMLKRLIGEDLDIHTVLEPALGRVKADPGQIEQVLINLAVNARDAMPQGGMLTIETANVELNETYCQTRPDVRPGTYVMLAVSDTGCGMDEETKACIFEPFFTTKEVGKGTGLGLATVYGIIKQSEGHIAVYSEPGHGATFKVYLPVVQELASSGKSHDGLKLPLRGTETILLVEDEPALRALARHILELQGYTVVEASQGDKAIRIAEEYKGTIHLLVTDVVMPVMGGRKLAERLVILQPDVKVLYLSGYADDAVVRHGVLHADTAFLQKPFTPSALAQKVREVLDKAK